MDIYTSLMDRGQPAGWGCQRPRSVLERGRSSNHDEGRSHCITWKLYVEAFAATAFALGLGVLELKGLIQALFNEVDQGAIDQGQTLRVHDDLDASRFENGVFWVDLIGVIHHVG